MVKIGLVGVGHWGKNHLKTLNELDGSNPVIVCDNGQQKVKIPKDTNFTRDYSEVVRDDSIEAVIIATPTSTHYELAKDFLESGKNVLVEKPLCESSEKGEEICKIAEDKGLVLMVGDIFKYNPSIRHILDLKTRGELGDIRYIESRRVGLGPIRKDVSSLWDLATHDIYISNMIVGKKPARVSSSGISHNGVFDDISIVNLFYDNQKIISTIYVNWEHPIKERRLVVGGSKKSISFDDIQVDEKIRIIDKGVDYSPSSGDVGEFISSIRDGEIKIPKIPYSQPLSLEIEDFIECVKGSRSKPIADGSSAIDTLKVLEAAERSRIEGGLEIRI